MVWMVGYSHVGITMGRQPVRSFVRSLRLRRLLLSEKSPKRTLPFPDSPRSLAPQCHPHTTRRCAREVPPAPRRLSFVCMLCRSATSLTHSLTLEKGLQLPVVLPRLAEGWAPVYWAGARPRSLAPTRHSTTHAAFASPVAAGASRRARASVRLSLPGGMRPSGLRRRLRSSPPCRKRRRLSPQAALSV